MNDRDLPAFLHRFFTPFDKVSAPLAAPLELVRHVVWGAVDYARQLGFEPAPDFELAARHLGPWQETSAITFGRHGVPSTSRAPSTIQPSSPRPDQLCGQGQFPFHRASQGRNQLVSYDSGHGRA